MRLFPLGCPAAGQTAYGRYVYAGARQDPPAVAFFNKFWQAHRKGCLSGEMREIRQAHTAGSRNPALLWAAFKPWGPTPAGVSDRCSGPIRSAPHAAIYQRRSLVRSPIDGRTHVLRPLSGNRQPRTGGIRCGG